MTFLPVLPLQNRLRAVRKPEGKLSPCASTRICGIWPWNSSRVLTNTSKSAPWHVRAIAQPHGFPNPWEGMSLFPLQSLRETQLPCQKTISIHWHVSKTPPLAGGLPRKPLDTEVESKLSNMGFEDSRVSSVVAFTPWQHLAMSGIKLFIVYTMRSQVSWAVQGFGNRIQSFLLWAGWVSLRPGWCQ